ncbi:MarR family winged helix-turn-helix transcriptional regulator [Agromyces sp. NPDC004153]
MSVVSEIDEADWALWRGFLTMHRDLMRELDGRLQRDAGISQADYSVLLTLFDAPDRRLRPGALGEALGWEKSRLSHQLTRMAARGLVERAECTTDGRGSWVVLTRDGRRTLLHALRDHASSIRSLFLDALGPDEKRAMARASERVLERLDEAARREATVRAAS